MRSALLLLPFALVSTVSAPAAPTTPVHWRTSDAPLRSLRAGARFDVTISAQIDPGWHLYALEEPDGGPIATEVSLTEGDVANLLRVTESRPRNAVDKASGKLTPLFDAKAAFTLHLQLPGGTEAGRYTVHVMLRYQSCDEHVCLPPHTDTVSVSITVAR